MSETERGPSLSSEDRSSSAIAMGSTEGHSVFGHHDRELKYAVNDRYCTIQGEGQHTGKPMLLYRLHGCPVGCPFCDTKETWYLDPSMERATLEDAQKEPAAFTWMTAEEIAQDARDHSRLKWILLTGGEPALYPLEPLATALHKRGFSINLETSGTADGCLKAGIGWICVSPKIDMPGKKPLLMSVLKAAHELKLVIGKPSDMDQYQSMFEDMAHAGITDDKVISLQPMSQSPKATDLCVQIALSRGYRVSLQTHKYMNLR